MNSDIQRLAPDKVYGKLSTTTQGLSELEVETRRQRFGNNIIEEFVRTGYYARLIANFTHMMAVLLWAGGAIAFIAGMPQLGIAIWLVNIINGVFSFWQEYRAEKATQTLQKLLPQKAVVIRSGVEQSVLADELVPGDVIVLSQGDHISADARLVSEAELRVDQSILTGESEPVPKASLAISQENLTAVEVPNLVFAGTNVVAGNGRAVVFATGMDRELGKIAHLTQSLPQDLSPLQKEMQTATKIITIMVILIGGFFFLLAITFGHINFTDSAIFTLGMIVAFVPEGMLPTVTLALAISSQRMSKRNALIKRLSSVETLGCTTVICSDKTGTLTKNEMTVHDIWLPPSASAGKSGNRLSVTGTGYGVEGEIMHHGKIYSPEQETGLHELLQAALLCNNARLVASTDESAHWSVLGDPTEAALLVATQKGGLDLQLELAHSPRIDELPFESSRKRMSTIHQVYDEGQPTLDRVALAKGSPLETLSLCTNVLQNGKAVPLSSELRASIVAANDQYARQGLRVLAVASRKLPRKLKEISAVNVEQDLTFLGLIAMMDPPRPEVIEAVKACQSAGVRIIMITGDYGLTAESIAKQIGITRKRIRVVSGSELDYMDDNKLRNVLAHEVIFARSSPRHKLRIVATLQGLGHIVAVTGDGVNDAPALKKADIGVAMGCKGTDVAKEAADMILTDDNFASIVSAIEEGRAVYANIRKFVTYIFTSNAPEAVPFIIFVLSRASIPLALTVMQVIFIDLGTDMAPALALGAEPPEPDVMNRPPRNRKEHIVTRSVLIRSYVYLGLIQSGAAMVAFFFMYWMHGYHGFFGLPHTGNLYRSATAMTLATVVATQVGNLFAQRTERLSSFKIKAFVNPLIWIGIAVELTLIFSVIYIPFFQHIFQTASLPPSSWLFIFAWTPLLLMADELRKWIVRRRAATAG